MKAYYRLCAVILAAVLLMTAAINYVIIGHNSRRNGFYRYEAKRLADDINDTGSYDLADYPHLTGVFSESEGRLYVSNEPYVIVETDKGLYRVEYTADSQSGDLLLVTDLLFGGFFLLTAAILLYIRQHIVRPFARLNKVPQELARGNLAVPIPEEKSRFFGKFTWGVNLLRETIENSRRKELSLQREKKLLLLSLSHDIKTPLQAIKLNAKALSRGLYRDEDKRREAAESINARADEIEGFMSQITQAASEDFMSFEVVMGEVFLSEMVTRVCERYVGQLALTDTELNVGEFSDRLLACDPDRLAECLQNLIENAIKYGDGRRISLGFDCVDGCELITVTNTGCTIEAAELTQIFDSFHRGSNADKVQGSGLGLFICRKLMTLMNGEVFAEIRDGCFCITLVVKLA